jgi:hypothetical protein
MACGGSVSQAQKPATPLRMDPAGAMGGTAGQVFDEIVFTTLESNGDSEFGKIDQLEVTDAYYIIRDGETNSILVFAKDGKFHSRIGAEKMVSDKSYRMYTFQWDQDSNQIRIPYDNWIYCFNADGSLIRKYDGGCRCIHHVLSPTCKAFFNYQLDPWHWDSTCYEFTVMDKNGAVKNYFPYIPRKSNLQGNEIMWCWVSPFFRNFDDDSSLFVLRNYDYSIYRLTPNSLSPAYTFIFPIQYSLPEGFSTLPSFNGKRMNYILHENKNAIYGLSNIYKIGNNLLFKTHSPAGNGSYIYHLPSEHLLQIEKISPDEHSYFLPVTDAGTGADFANTGVLNAKGSSLYTSYSSNMLFQQYQATLYKHPKYPPQLLQYLREDKNKRGNPILIRLKLKEKP